jgi:hypothetical protein
VVMERFAHEDGCVVVCRNEEILVS